MRLTLLIPAVLGTVSAHAQNAPPAAPNPQEQGRPESASIFAEPVGLMIAGFDTDGDGVVTRAEFDAGVRRSFDAVDPGHKGDIGYLGFSDWQKRWLGSENALPSPFESDRNGDNRITFDELAQRLDLFFTRFDVDKDGRITRAELLTVRTPAAQGGRRGGRPPK